MLKVKIISRTPTRLWLRYFPNHKATQLNNCEFIFDQDATDYDWAVVYEDIPKSSNHQKLACNQNNTLLVTTEPPNIKQYDPEYTRQFGHVLTSQAPEFLPHKNHIYSQAGLLWYYGFDDESERSWQEISGPCPEKTKILSTVTSNKQQQHTLHKQRYELAKAIDDNIPEMELFGKGIQPVNDKADAMDAYKYHVAIENYNGKHHWTEKLSDSYLACCLPFYSGCTNIEEYFPEESYIKIDISDHEKSIAIIRQAIDNNEYEKRLPAILEAKRRVLEDYGFFSVVSKIINEKHEVSTSKGEGLLSRHAIRRKYPFTCMPRVIKKEVLHAFKNYVNNK